MSLSGLRTGGKGFAFTFALSLTNFCVKPVKAMQVHLSQHSSSSKSEKLTAGAKGLGIGVASGLGSLCFGVPSSLLLLLSSSCVGALNQIQAVPMLESVSCWFCCCHRGYFPAAVAGPSAAGAAVVFDAMHSVTPANAVIMHTSL